MKNDRPSLRRRALRVAAALVAVAATAAGLPGRAPAFADAPTCGQQSPYNSGIGTGDAHRRPVILVHGWDGASSSMVPVEHAIDGDRSIASRVVVKYFDYRSVAEQWAAIPSISACLADYVTAVADSYRRAGGDGRVIVVAHSMGGLAARFATSSQFAAHPIGDRLAALITVDTPHLGSPFGGDALGVSALSHLVEDLHAKHLLDFPVGTDGAACLAPHTPPDNAIGGGCVTPPYLPPTVHVDQIAGSATVDRSLFGVHLYDIPLDSDGIVPAGSSLGYPRSGPTGHMPVGTSYGAHLVSCRVTWDQLQSAAAQFGISAAGSLLGLGPLADVLSTLASPLNDSAALDELLAGQTGPALLQFLAVVNLAASCSHTGMLTSADSLYQVRTAIDHALDAAVDCGIVHDSIVNTDVQVSITRGSIPCPTAVHVVDTYYNHPPSPLQGSGGYVSFDGWSCYSTSGTVARQTGHDGDCAEQANYDNLGSPSSPYPNISIDRPGVVRQFLSKLPLDPSEGVSFQGLGPLRIGMTFEQAQAATSTRLASTSDCPNNPRLSWWRVVGPGVYSEDYPEFVGIDGRLAGIIMYETTPSWHTVEGIHVGDSPADLQRAYPDLRRVDIAPDSPSYEIVDGDSAMVFDISQDGKTVTDFKVGQRNVAEAYELCG